MLYARWRIMGTGPPAFTEVDNPASFEENVFLRVSGVAIKEGSKKRKSEFTLFCEQLYSHWIFLNTVLDFDCDF